MSLKAYDGLMTRNGFAYLQDNIRERLGDIFIASKNYLIKRYYVPTLSAYFDGGMSIKNYVNIFGVDAHTSAKVEKYYANSKPKAPFDEIIDVQRILQTSYFVNPTSVHLTLNIESVDDKLLVLPSILVPEHKNILSNFLTDWYAQDQTDPDESVEPNEWEERVADWYNFNETPGMATQIKLFDPDHFYNDMVSRLCEYGLDKLMDDIIKEMPSTELRTRSEAKKFLINEKLKGDGGDLYKYLTIKNEITDEVIDEYLSKNTISLPTITKELLTKQYE